MMTDALFLDLQVRLGKDLWAFLPELILSGAIVLLLVFRMLPRMQHRSAGLVALMLSVLALGAALEQWFPMSQFDPRADQMIRSFEMFGGMLVFDNQARV